MNPLQHPETRLKRILFCTDFSDSADAAFGFAVDAAIRRPGCQLYILHVIHEIEAQFWKSYIYEVENVDDKAKHTIDDKIAQTYLAGLPQDLQVKVEAKVGPEAETILEFAEQNKIDLIVIGRHGRSGVRRALFGKVAEKIVRKSECAVLVIPLGYAAQPVEPA